ncbi:uncharacterized protein LOC144630767 [Oculina patagonica]
MHLCKAYHFLSRISADCGTVSCSHNKPAPSPPHVLELAVASMITKVEIGEEGNTGAFLSSSLGKTALFVFASSDPLSAAKDQVGDRIIARWSNNDYYPGKVEAFPSDTKIKIKFDDGDEITHSVDDVSAVIADKATKRCPLGQHVIATWKGSAKYFIGYVIEKVRSNQQENRGCKVLFDDGDVEWYKPKDLRMFPDHTSPLEVGARVFARWTNGLYYCGFVVNAADSRLYIHFDDGDNLDYSESEAEQALVLDVLPSSTQLQPNTRVIGAGPESHRYNPGVIEKVQDPEPGSSSKLSSYYVKFDNEDGSNEFFYQIRVM